MKKFPYRRGYKIKNPIGEPIHVLSFDDGMKLDGNLVKGVTGFNLKKRAGEMADLSLDLLVLVKDLDAD